MNEPAKLERGTDGLLPAKPKKWRRPPKFGGWPQTLERIKIIRRHLNKTDKEIGCIIGISRNAVHALRVRFGVAKRRGNTQRKERFIVLMRGLPPGLTPQTIALKLGIPEGRAIYYAHLAGYRWLSKKEITNRRRKEQIKSLPPGLTLGMVAKRLKVSY